MKKVLICLVLLLFSCTLFACTKTAGAQVLKAEEYLRIHVRANDNGYESQRVKLMVKDAIVQYLTPLLSSCKSKEEAKGIVLEKRDQLTALANEVLLSQGASYTAACSVKSEVFPTRIYQGITLPGGRYEALIFSLGKAQGENWWCVVYPPLCFAGGERDVEYRSFIYDWIQKLKG